MPYNKVMDNAAKKFGRRYPWGHWFGQRSFTLVRGRDYDCRTSSMAQQVYQASRRKGHKIKIELPEDEMEIRVSVLGVRSKDAGPPARAPVRNA